MFLDPYNLPMYLLMLAVFIPLFGVGVVIYKLFHRRG